MATSPSKKLDQKKYAQVAIERAETKAIKAKVHAMEMENFTQLILYRSMNGFWKMGGHSALIYYHRIMPKLGSARRSKLKHDDDSYFRFRDGVIAFKSPESVEERLRTQRIFAREHQKDYWTFDLGYTVSENEIEQLRNIDKERMAQVNQIVVPVHTNANIYNRIVAAEKEIYDGAKKMEGVARKVYGYPALRLLIDCHGIYVAVANKRHDYLSGMKKIETYLSKVLYDVQNMMELGLLDLKRCQRVADDIVEASRIVQKSIKTYQKDAA